MAGKIVNLLLIALIIAVVFVLGQRLLQRVQALADSQSWSPSLKKVKIIINNTAWEAEVAADNWTQAKGLAGRKQLPPRQGMLFVFKKSGRRAFWMKGMNFPLDIIWINDNQVIDISRNVQPLSLIPPPSSLRQLLIRPAQPAQMALEINAGEARRFGVQAGDKVKIVY